MKRSGCAAPFGSAVPALLVLLLAVLAGLAFRFGAITPDPTRSPGVREPPPEPEPVPDADAYLPTVGSLHQFHREDDGDRLRLTYGFIDYRGQPRHVACEISKQAYQQDVTSFGYFADEMASTPSPGACATSSTRGGAAGMSAYVHFESLKGTATAGAGGSRKAWRRGRRNGWKASCGFRRLARPRLARQKEELVANTSTSGACA